MFHAITLQLVLKKVYIFAKYEKNPKKEAEKKRSYHRCYRQKDLTAGL